MCIRDRDKKEIKFLGDKIILELILMLNDEDYKPVSYTHLDVYKRQVQIYKISYQNYFFLKKLSGD